MCASSDFLFNALPQLVEALRQLQQRIDHCVDFAYAQRCSLLQKELLERHEADHLESGDDMRQDALVLQMVSFMNGIWLSEHLDLRMITFRCMPVGYRKGMAELVLDCATLCEIQKEFRDS
ncbi:hypothetical protein COOONC_16425 [Cooperia oncophora]